MDGVLCDDLLHVIIQRLPFSSFTAVSLVSKRWLSALRSSTTKLSLSIPLSSHSLVSLSSASLASTLSHYPNLSSLAILSSAFDDDSECYSPPLPPLLTPAMFSYSSDTFLLLVAAAPCASRLTHLRFVAAASPVSSAALLACSASLTHLTSLHLSSVFPFSFRWLARFPSMKFLSLVFLPKSPTALDPFDEGEQLTDDDTNQSIAMLPLESLSLSGVRASDKAMSWVWRRCGKLRCLRLRACEGTGDGPSSPFFPLCLAGLLELELRACRAIADLVLLCAADHCHSLTSLLLYDGGGRDALQHFISRRALGLHFIDLRLPLDLHNDHLFAIATACAGASDSPRLSTLRLQSCCLVTGDGLCAVARAATGKAIEELALINCDVIERESGLLSVLGQSLPRLQRLDLSYNETLRDKELGAMLNSCDSLVEIKLRGCSSLTDATVLWLLMWRRLWLEVVDLSRCPGISIDGIEIFVLSSSKLTRISVEKEKVSGDAMAMVSRRAIQIDD